MKAGTLIVGALALGGVAWAGHSYWNKSGWLYEKAIAPMLGEKPAPKADAQGRPPGGPPAAGGAPAGPPPAPVVVATSRSADVPITLHTIGNVQAFSSVSLKSQVEGQILRVHFSEGQMVKKGDLLFSLDQRPFVAALKQAEAQVARDRALLEKAKADLARVQELAAKDFATRARFDEMKANVASFEAAIAAGEAQVETARLRLEFTEIKSPIDGRVGSILVNVGNLVRTNDQSALVVINQIRPVLIQFSVPESYLGEIKQRMAAGEVRIRAQVPNSTSAPAIGLLTFINNAVDTTTGTIQLKATYDNADERFTPGQFLNVVIELAVIRNATLVPAVAIQAGQRGAYVYVVKQDQTVELRNVRTGANNGDDVVVVEGLRPGEIVVVDGQLRLRPGARVAVRPAGAPPGAPRPNGQPGGQPGAPQKGSPPQGERPPNKGTPPG